MNPQPHPHLKSQAPTPDQARPAEPAPGTTASSAPKVAAEGALSAVRPDPHLVTVTGIMPGLQVRLTGTPVADWLCRCGNHERATGRAAVIELTTRVRVGVCPHASTAVPTVERSQAA